MGGDSPETVNGQQKLP